EPVDHLLPYEIVVAAILELNPDETQRVHGVGADEPQSRRAGDGDFERDGDVALHLLRRLAGILGDDFDDGRSGIRIGLDVESGECRIAHRQEGGEADQYQRPAREAERDQAGKHASTGLTAPHHARAATGARPLAHCRHSLSTKIAPRPATSSPALSPSRICMRPSCSIPIATRRRRNSIGSSSTQTTAWSPSRITACTGTEGEGSSSPVAILKLANISDLSAPSGLGTSERTTMRRVVASVPALMAVTRALNTRSGSALTLTSTSCPSWMEGISFSGT